MRQHDNTVSLGRTHLSSECRHHAAELRRKFIHSDTAMLLIRAAAEIERLTARADDAPSGFNNTRKITR